MLYKINNNYYVRVGRKYIKVKLEVKNGDVDLIPVHNDFLEENNTLKIEEQPFTDDFKKNIINRSKKDIFDTRSQSVDSEMNKYHNLGKK